MHRCYVTSGRNAANGADDAAKVRQVMSQMASFEEWDSFYLIVGGAAGALIGLQFVVMTLLADRPRLVSPEAGAAFSTPTVVHFATALLLAAIMRMPWHHTVAAASLWGGVSLVAFGYALTVIRRVRRQHAYEPDFDDWCFYVIIPIVAYAALGVAAFMVTSYEHESLFAVAGATVVLLFVGIHNSWDAVSYHVLVARQRGEPETSGGVGRRDARDAVG